MQPTPNCTPDPDNCPECDLSPVYKKRCERDDCPLQQYFSPAQDQGLDPSQDTGDANDDGDFFDALQL